MMLSSEPPSGMWCEFLVECVIESLLVGTIGMIHGEEELLREAAVVSALHKIEVLVDVSTSF